MLRIKTAHCISVLGGFSSGTTGSVRVIRSGLFSKPVVGVPSVCIGGSTKANGELSLDSRTRLGQSNTFGHRSEFN